MTDRVTSTTDLLHGAGLRHQRYEHPPGAKDFWLSDYVQYVDPPISMISDLNNDIHPIFKKSKFGAGFDYDVLKMPLRLATRILQSDPAVMFLVTMVDGDLFTFTRDRTSGQRSWKPTAFADINRTYEHLRWTKPFARFPRKDDAHVTDTTRRRAHQILAQLERALIGYELDNAQSEGSCIPAVRPLTAGTVKAFPEGVSASINVSREKYKLLAELHGEHVEGTPPSKSLLLLQFIIADTLVHELGHAIGFAGSGTVMLSGAQPHYMCNPITENGYDFSDVIWGGLMNGSGRSRNDFEYGELIMHEWPSGILLEEYTEYGYAIGCVQTLKPHMINYRVPIVFVEKLLTNAYWSNEVDGKGIKALKAPRVGTWVFKRVASQAVPCDILDLKDFELLSVRHRYALSLAMGLKSNDPETGRENLARAAGEETHIASRSERFISRLKGISKGR